jgi:hypothetical protein
VILRSAQDDSQGQSVTRLHCQQHLGFDRMAENQAQGIALFHSRDKFEGEPVFGDHQSAPGLLRMKPRHGWFTNPGSDDDQWALYAEREGKSSYVLSRF